MSEEKKEGETGFFPSYYPKHARYGTVGFLLGMGLGVLFMGLGQYLDYEQYPPDATEMEQVQEFCAKCVSGEETMAYCLRCRDMEMVKKAPLTKLKGVCDEHKKEHDETHR